MARALKKIKTDESNLRKSLAESILGVDQFIKGIRKTNRVEGGYTFAINQKMNYKLDEGILSALWKELSDEERACINYKPSLSIAAYKKLPEDSLLHEAITTKPAMPTIKSEEI